MSKKNWFQRSESFVRDYAGGVGARDLKRLFDRDASRAFGVVTREQEGEEPKGDVGRFFYRAKILFLGLSFKLTPPRRVLFGACIVLSLLALQGADKTSVGGGQFIFFHVAAIAGLVFLIVLELADRIMVRDELEVARELQRDLLPPHPPVLEGWDFAFSYRTANTIGGDYYDFVPLEDGRMAVVIGDASGHGIAAGLLMAIASSALKLGMDVDPTPAAVARFVNRALCRSGGNRAFMTLFLGLIEPSTGRMEFVSAGHPYPMLRRAAGAIVELGEGGLPLGIREDVSSPTGEVLIEPGDQLLLYTDGVAETLDPTGADYGYDRVRRALELGGPVAAIHDRIVREMVSFQGDAPAYDDRSIVVISRGGGVPDPPIDS
jgi:serine phosphatase RsbU (regulator of sigma subunit)